MFQLLEIRQKTPDWFATTSMDHKMEKNLRMRGKWTGPLASCPPL